MPSPTSRRPSRSPLAIFLEWPTANQVAQVEGWYDKALGVKVNWRPFAVSRGVPIEVIAISVSTIGSTSCVVANRTGITAEDAEALEGKKVAIPFGTAAEHTMIKMLEHLGVDADKLDPVDMAPPPPDLAEPGAGTMAARLDH